MNYSQTFALLLCLGYLTLSQAKPTGIVKATTSKTSHPAVKKSSIHHHTRYNHYHGKSHKRHLRKKKQFIMGGLAGGLPGYGMPDLSALMTNPQAYGYTPSPSVDPTYGLAALGGGAQPGLMSNSMQDPNSGVLQSRQSLFNSFTGATDQSLASSYNNNGYGGYANGGLQDTGSLQSSVPSLAGYDQNGLSSSLSNAMAAGLGNAYGNGGLGNAFSNGINSYAGNDANQMAGLGGLNSLSPSVNQASNLMGNAGNNLMGNTGSNLMGNTGSNLMGNTGSNFMGNAGSNLMGNTGSNLMGNSGSNLMGNTGSNLMGNTGSSLMDSTGSSLMGNSGSNKYAADSLSAGLDTPNGIANIANLLNSAQTSFDSDGQGQLVNNQVSNADMNKFAQRFGSQPTTSQSGLGIPGVTQGSSAAAAEAQSFENQLSHLSNDKLKLGGNTHANYANFADNIDPNNLNEIGQIASTGISDNNLQRLLGQLINGQFGHAHHPNPSQAAVAGVGGLPSDSPSTGTYDTGNAQGQIEDQAGYSSPVIAPVIHGQTIRVHASDKPRYHLADKGGHASASKTALNVQKQATEEHKEKLQQLKEKLKMLRQKLRRLKQEYNDDPYDDYTDNDIDFGSDLSEKSDTETLDYLKSATEKALKELKQEMAKVKGKGKKVIFIHKFSPQSTSDVSGKKKGDQTIAELETEMLELIDDDHRIINNELNKKHRKHRSNNRHVSLTELDKQAEQEVNYLTSKNPKVVRKKHHRRTHSPIFSSPNAGLHIHIPEPVEEGEVLSRDRKPSFSHDDLADKFKPKEKPPEEHMSYDSGSSHPSDDLGGIEKLLNKHHQEQASNNTTREKHSLGFFSIGCWRDQPERALMSLEGIFPILDGNDYMRRKYAIRKCAQVARVQGFSAFAVENGGHCLGDKNVLQTYSMYGPSKGCKQDGKGGPWSMEVYKFTTSSAHRKTRRGDILRAIGPEYIFYKGTNGLRKKG